MGKSERVCSYVYNSTNSNADTGRIVASNIYRAEDKPRYKPGHGTVLGYLAAFLLGGSILQHVLLRRENAKRRAGARDGWIEGKTKDEIDRLGDKRPDFMYTL